MIPDGSAGLPSRNGETLTPADLSGIMIEGLVKGMP